MTARTSEKVSREWAEPRVVWASLILVYPQCLTVVAREVSEQTEQQRSVHGPSGSLVQGKILSSKMRFENCMLNL